MAEPLKVLHCVAGKLYGGVETFLRTLAENRELCPGLEQEFATCFEGLISEQLRGTGAPVHDLGRVRFSRPWTVWQARRRLAGLVKSKRFDVVVNHGCWPQMLCGQPARRGGAAVVYWMHEMIADGRHWVERGAARVVPDLVLVHSHCTAATLPRIYPKLSSEVLRYPVQAHPVNRPEARAAVRRELGTADTDVVIVTACRLEPWKGHSLLLQALGRLRDKPGWTSWVAGGVQRPHEQVYLDDLQAAARAEGVGDRIRFLGHRTDVPRLLAAADIHCQPNTSPEPFGIAYIEALYAGLPVVSTRMGGAVEIFTDACGVLVPPADPESLASALSALIDDPQARERLGNAGPARAAEMCAPAAVLAEMERQFKKLDVRHKAEGRGPSVDPGLGSRAAAPGHSIG
jgi:glycosyltransferase involved in cell wall biosynthesis